jgi:CheY-like chemotaxis protein/nitrogen-specific signal transduction histidine kinase
MLLLVIEDITDRYRLEMSEKQARVEAERADRAKDLFLATLSHELRTPLSSILLSAQLLQMTTTDDPRILRASAAIERAVGTQAKLIDDLLDISRVVAGKLLLDLQEVDFATVVQRAIEVARLAAEVKGIRLDFACGSKCPVKGDPARLQQVVANLLSNSIKFTPSGGIIVASLEAQDDHALLTVTDNGVGLAAGSIPHIFDRFVQAESAMTRSHGGLGLGLAIVHHIVTAHDGEVAAASAGEGEGATFTVKLQLAPHGAEELDGPPTAGANRIGARSIDGVRVLVVDDDEDTRTTCATVLEVQGADVRTACSAADGLAVAAQFAPQVILCDIAMPGEDGYAFIRQLRSGTRGRDVPAAALTALATEEDRKQALDAGFQIHLAKPIGAEGLASAVSTLVAWPEQLARRYGAASLKHE